MGSRFLPSHSLHWVTGVVSRHDRIFVVPLVPPEEAPPEDVPPEEEPPEDAAPPEEEPPEEEPPEEEPPEDVAPPEEDPPEEAVPPEPGLPPSLAESPPDPVPFAPLLFELPPVP